MCGNETPKNSYTEQVMQLLNIVEGNGWSEWDCAKIAAIMMLAVCRDEEVCFNLIKVCKMMADNKPLTQEGE